MFIGVVRTVFVRVRPDTLVVFVPNDDDDDDAGDDVEGGVSAPKPSFLSRVKAGWKNDQSLFAWANKGTWETAETADEETRREAEWFRIGFEPLFVDFTKAGAWFVAFTMVEVRGQERNKDVCFYRSRSTPYVIRYVYMFACINVFD